MIGEIFNVKTDRLFYWPADGTVRPALLSNGHWIIRCDAGRGTAGLALDAAKACKWDGGTVSGEVPGVEHVWNAESLAPDGRVKVEIVGCDWRMDREERASDLRPGTIRLGKRDGRYIGYGPSMLILADDGGKARVGIDPVYYSAALDLGLTLWAKSGADLDAIQLRQGAAVVGLVMPSCPSCGRPQGQQGR